MSGTTHNPKRLTQLLSEFSNDYTTKFLTHQWDYINCPKHKHLLKDGEYDYETFMREVTKRWDEYFSTEFFSVSVAMHERISVFIFGYVRK